MQNAELLALKERADAVLKVSQNKHGWAGWYGAGSIYSRPGDIVEEEFSALLRVRAIDEAFQFNGHAVAVAVNSKGSLEGWSCGSGIRSGTDVRHSIVLTRRTDAICVGVHRVYMLCDAERESLFTFARHGESRHFHLDHNDLP